MVIDTIEAQKPNKVNKYETEQPSFSHSFHSLLQTDF